MDLELAGKTVLITGGTDGLGLALATRLVGEGANVAICGRDEERLARAADRLGATVLARRVDVTVPTQCDDLVAATIERFGRLDGLVNNAGRSAASSIAQSSDEEWREDYELKVLAALRLARACLPHLARTRGSVLNVLAISARTPGANSTPTAASRSAGLALTKALATEAGPLGVRANAVLIGLMESGQWVRRKSDPGQSMADYYAVLAQRAGIPLGRYGRGEEFADVATFLLSARSSYVTGAALALDGGLAPVI